MFVARDFRHSWEKLEGFLSLKVSFHRPEFTVATFQAQGKKRLVNGQGILQNLTAK